FLRWRHGCTGINEVSSSFTADCFPMADFGEFLLKKKIVGPEQLAEAKAMAQKNGHKLTESLVKLGYASSEQITKALALMEGYKYIDLKDAPIPPSVVELVPESVARENAVIPLAEDDGALMVLVSDPYDYETIEKLQFILNRK